MLGKCAACHEKDRLIDTLAEQVEWLRAQLGSPSLRPTLNPSEQMPVGASWAVTNDVWMSEAEEDAQALLKAGRITEEQIPEVLEALGYANNEVHFAD